MHAKKKNNALPWLWLSGLVIALDFLTKRWAETALNYNDPVAVMPFFNFTLLHNTGAAFSFLAQSGGWQRWLFTVLALLVSMVLVIWLYRLPRCYSWLGSALGLILGGAIGNLADRVRLGYVVDFIDIYYRHWHWPAFNLADSAISIGAVMLIIDALWLHSETTQPGK